MVAEYDKALENGDIGAFRGRVHLQNVGFERMSQSGITHGALRFLRTGYYASSIAGCSFREGQSLALYVFKSTGITFSQNVVYKTKRNAVVLRGGEALKIEENLLIANERRAFDETRGLRDFQVAVDVCSGELESTCTKVVVKKNIIAGAIGVGFLAPAADCAAEGEGSGNEFS